MNKLAEFHEKLDASNFEATSGSVINTMLQEVNQFLQENGEMELLKKSELERESFELNKSFNYDDDGKLKGVNWKISGIQTDADGVETPMVWPDISKFSKEDFEYIEQRYIEVKNLYAKTEFGLILYFQKPTPFSNHNDFKKNLCKELFELSKIYKQKSEDPDAKISYLFHFFNTVRSALKIAIIHKFTDLVSEISQWLFEVHTSWDLKRKNSLRVLLDISLLIIDDYKVLKDHFDITAILKQNLKAVEEQEKEYIWGAIYNIDVSAKLDAKAGIYLIDYKLKKAQLYEALAIQEQERPHRQLAVIQFVEDALRIYRSMKDESNIKRLEEWYQRIRGSAEFGSVGSQIDEDKLKVIIDRIEEEISHCDKLQVLDLLSISPMFLEIETIKLYAEESLKEHITLHLFPTSIVDKYGNTIAQYRTEEERIGHAFWQAFDFDFQFGVRFLTYFFFHAYENNKLDFESTIDFLGNTWLNESIERNYNGRIESIIPLDIIRPPLQLFFDEFIKWHGDHSYPFNTVVILESLTLKIEPILRFLCERIGIATFKTKEDGIVMEKNIDDLLANLQNTAERPTGFEEKDRLFIKYVMSEKSGLNLRNKIAHGLLDINEYSLEHIIIIYSIIIRFGRYKMK